MAAKMNAAGAPTPFPNPTMIGVLNSMAEIGADPVTVRNSTPPSPTACLRSLATSLRFETSKSSATPVRAASPPPSTDTSDCAMVPPRSGRRRSPADPAQLIGPARALWCTSHRGQYQLVEAMTRVLVREISRCMDRLTLIGRIRYLFG